VILDVEYIMKKPMLSTVKAREMNFITKPAEFSRRRILHAGLATGLTNALPLAALAAELPEPLNEVWNDAARSRDVPALLRWPAGKPMGVMLYSHGLGGKKEGGDVWGKAWARMGLLVVHLQHMGSDNRSLKGGFPALREAMKPEQLVARMQDVRFALAEMGRRQASGAAYWAAVPLQKIAVGGHSFGARSTLLAAGWQRHGLDCVAIQPKAFIALSPALGQGVSLSQARKELAAVTRPLLVCTGSLDGEILNNGETPASRRMVYEALPPGKKALLWLHGADHLTFAGNGKQIPSTALLRRSPQTLASEDAHHEHVARLSTDWLSEQLLGKPMGAVQGLGAEDQWMRG
jgi:predicted dienelactone hydrolase